MNDRLRAALEYVESGLSLIPIGANSKTTPEKFGWKTYQRRRPTDAELRAWVNNHPGLGIVGGKVSGDAAGSALEILDLESIAPLEEFRELVEEAAPGLLSRLPRTKTPSGGRHIFYRCEIVEGNQKLAQRAEDVVDENLPRTDTGEIDEAATKKLGLRKVGGKYFRIRTLIETRGEGGQVLSPLCLRGTHPSGGVYELIHGDLRNIPTITSQERDILLAAARAYNEFVEPAKVKGSNEAAREVDGIRPGADYNARADAFNKTLALLENHGWRVFRRQSIGPLLSRPGVNDHCSARLFNDGAFYVFSTNASPFDGGIKYSPFGVYTELNYPNDYSAAAKALAAEGYGSGSKASKKKPVTLASNGAARSAKAKADPGADDQTPADIKPLAGPVKHNQVFAEILSRLNPVNFYGEARLADGEKLNQKHFCVVSVRKVIEIAKKLDCGMCKHLAFVYIYNGQYWRQVDKDEMAKFLGEAAEKLGVDETTAQYHKFRDELLKQFMATAFLPRPERPENVTLINLANGTFEITPTGQQLRGFKREDFLTYQLPFNYDESAQCEKWRAFLDKVLPDEDGRQEECAGANEGREYVPFKARQSILAEFIGYCFTRLKLEKVLLPYGSGANGKSVFFDVMTALLGVENISHFGLGHLTHEYNRAMVAGKLLNYASEVSSKIESETFKQMASGEPVQARLPYAPPFTMRDYAKLAFNCNELPRAVEHNKAFFRRFLIIPFDVTVEEDEQDKELAKKITETELPGVFNWVLDGLRRLLSQKKFTECDKVKTALAAYQKESDSVAMFLDDEGWKPDIRAQVSLRDLYHDYKKYCGDNGYKALGKQNFSRRLEANGMTRTDSGHPKFFVHRES